MSKAKTVVYTGEVLRDFLKRKNLTYQQAAQELSIDKNTLGKAVRGGNLNVNILLAIVNNYDFPISYFFKEEYLVDDSDPKTNSSLGSNGESSGIYTAADSDEYYLKKHPGGGITQLLAMKDEEIQLQKQMIDNYKHQIALLQKELEKQKLDKAKTY